MRTRVRYCSKIVPLHALQAADSIHRGIQVIYQDPSLFPNLTVGENIVISEILAKGTRGSIGKGAAASKRGRRKDSIED